MTLLTLLQRRARTGERGIALQFGELGLGLVGAGLELGDLGLVALELGVELGSVGGQVDLLLQGLEGVAVVLGLLDGAEGGEGGVGLQGGEGAGLGGCLSLELGGLGRVVLGLLVELGRVGHEGVELLEPGDLAAVPGRGLDREDLVALGDQRGVSLQGRELRRGLGGLLLDLVGLGGVVLGLGVELGLVGGELRELGELGDLSALGLDGHGVVGFLLLVALGKSGACNREQENVEELHLDLEGVKSRGMENDRGGLRGYTRRRCRRMGKIKIKKDKSKQRSGRTGRKEDTRRKEDESKETDCSGRMELGMMPRNGNAMKSRASYTSPFGNMSEGRRPAGSRPICTDVNSGTKKKAPPGPLCTLTRRLRKKPQIIKGREIVVSISWRML